MNKEYAIMGKKDNKTEEDTVREVLFSLFIAKLNDLTKNNEIQWNKSGNFYLGRWGFYELSLWETHFKIENMVSGEVIQINKEMDELTFLRKLLSAFSETGFVDTLGVILETDILRWNQLFQEEMKNAEAKT